MHEHSSSDEPEALGFAALLSQVQVMVAESGNPVGFDVAAWLSTWLKTPLAALGGAPPGSIMDTPEGRAVVSNLLARAQSGAYA